MDSLKVIELFSGIGSQSAALKRVGIDHEIVATADLDKEAMVSYAAIHCDLLEKMKTFSFPSENEMATLLSDRNIGFDFKTNKRFDWFKFVRSKSEKSKMKLQKYYCACVLQNNLGDINEIKELPPSDFWTYSFPCQDISVAGKGEGIVSGKTRSGCLYEVERLLNVAIENWTEPKYLMLENVKNLVGKKFKEQFEEWIQTLDALGYNTYWQVLNAKNYGIPQNRERVFAISIRKDCDDGSFVFPEPFELKIRLKDVLEEVVDEKYYIVNDKVNDLIRNLSEKDKLRMVENDKCSLQETTITCILTNQATVFESETEVANTLLAIDYKGFGNQGMNCVIETHEPIRMGGLYDEEDSKHQAGAVWDKEAIAPTIDTMQGGNRQPLIVEEDHIGNFFVKEATKKGYSEAYEGDSINIGNVNPSNRGQNGSVISSDGLARTITIEKGEGQKTLVDEPTNNYTRSLRIRKLTPKECFRLMGFSDEDFDKAEQVCCNSQLYKQAGNSIVVDVLCYIFANLFEKENENGQD